MYKRFRKPHFASVVGLAAASLALASAVLVCIALYNSFGTRLSLEFEDRVAARGGEVGLTIRSRLSEARSRLSEMALDNTVRVTLMLGVDSQLDEQIARYTNMMPGTSFFISRLTDNKLFGNVQDSARIQVARDILDGKVRPDRVQQDKRGRFYVAFKTPVSRRTSILGMAVCVFDLREALADSTGLRQKGERIFVADGPFLSDPFTGEKVPGPTRISGHDPQKVRVDNEPGLLVEALPLADFFLYSPLSPLIATRHEMLMQVALLTALVLLGSLAVSYFWTRKITRPLRIIASHAQAIAEGGGASAMAGVETPYLETEYLKKSLVSMLENLHRAEQKARYQELFQNVGDMVCIHDAQGNFFEANDLTYRLFGVDKDAFTKMSVFDVIPKDQHATVRRTLDRMPETASVQTRIILASGRVREVEVNARRISWKGGQGYLNVVRDVTDRNKAEREMATARRDAEQASRAKSEFLASMSHEIRTPLNSILGMADLLWETELSQDQRHYVKIFRNSGELLLGLINGILDLSKVEAGQMVLESAAFDLVSVVEQVARIMAVNAHKKGLELSYHVSPDVPRKVVGDSHRLQQVLVNLLGNAVKFTERGQVTLHVEHDPMQEDPGGILFIIWDTGVGIPPDKTELIFGNFSQADSSTTRRFGGTGLGLAISRRLVERMGGKIRVESEPGKGTMFSFTVTFGSAVNEPVVEQGSELLKGLRVLIVDGDSMHRRMVRRNLDSWGMICSETWNGREAVSMTGDAASLGKAFDLCFINMWKHCSEGQDLAAKLLEVSPLLRIYALVSSEYDGQSCVGGFSGCLTKPLVESDVRKAVSSTFFGIVQPPLDADQEKVPLLPPAAKSVRILLAEDSENNRMLVEFFLQKLPCKIDVAEDGERAFEMYTANKYDVVLMDIEMPNKDGYWATRSIREWETDNLRFPIPIIALTANAFPEDRERCFDAGCTDYLSKPVKKKILVQAISKAVGMDLEAKVEK